MDDCTLRPEAGPTRADLGADATQGGRDAGDDGDERRARREVEEDDIGRLSHLRAAAGGTRGGHAAPGGHAAGRGGEAEGGGGRGRARDWGARSGAGEFERGRTVPSEQVVEKTRSSALEMHRHLQDLVGRVCAPRAIPVAVSGRNLENG